MGGHDMKSDDTPTVVSDLLSQLPGATLDLWCNPGRQGTPVEPIEYRLVVKSPRALSILAHIAEAANVLLKVVVASEGPGPFDDPDRIRYTISVPQDTVIPGHPSQIQYVGSVVACKLGKCGAIEGTEVDRLLRRWKTTIPTADELVLALDRKQPNDLVRHWALHGFEALIPGLIAAFPRIKKWEGRNTILFELIPYARKRPDVIELALVGLKDPAYMVRMQACAILAYSLQKDSIPMLERLLKHKNKKTRDDAAAAIDAIKHQNHNYWFDREHTGSPMWTVSAEDEM